MGMRIARKRMLFLMSVDVAVDLDRRGDRPHSKMLTTVHRYTACFFDLCTPSLEIE